VSLKDLSTREQEVLALTAEGYSSREIGKKLFISPKTVDTYRSRIMDKLAGAQPPERPGAVRARWKVRELRLDGMRCPTARPESAGRR
jgi:DNA-binding NarL/FixJ family response regulator